ncbi:hypothetical protein D7D52_25895 [Nocardia yunnanensis]|uniref:Asp23/Gls24 family envelope stress response protein n=1 Tax=Nocardia yunnanensis TaxID=2382165 RepID=A0A386ZJ88_9NOCA|nr:hypothetical protein [Nocardia yunnanensis]AYF76679.1 hypothetical protein D7D52_25895 [Nocardia yunnanensis]
MSAPVELLDALAAALEAVPGVRPMPSLTGGAWLPRALRASAIELGADLIEIRVVATELPLRPLADRVAAALAPVLAGTAWAGATVRLVVAELAADALEEAHMT